MSLMLLLTDVKKNRAFCMWMGRPSAALATKHRGVLLFGEDSRLGWSPLSSSMHLERAAIIVTCSSVGVMHTGLNTCLVGMLKVLRLSGTCSSQKALRLLLTCLRGGALLEGEGDRCGAIMEKARWNDDEMGAA